MELFAEDITIDDDLNIETLLMSNPFFGILPLEHSDLNNLAMDRVEEEMACCDSDRPSAILTVIGSKSQ